MEKIVDYDSMVVEKALDYCLENNFYNANQLAELVTYYQKEQDVMPETSITPTDVPLQAHIMPVTSKIDTYEKIIS